jgi:hypothetical protein
MCKALGSISSIAPTSRKGKKVGKVGAGLLRRGLGGRRGGVTKAVVL